MSTARAAPKWTEELIPARGETFVARTVSERDELEEIGRVVRQTDQPGVWTVANTDRWPRWIRYDTIRKRWVRAYGQGDGEPVPPEPERL